MKRKVIIFFLIGINLCYSQSKTELIETLIESNLVQLDYTNMGNEFGLLLDKITTKELHELAKHKNAIIRTYAKVGMIEKGDGNIIQFLNEEIEANKNIIVFSACNGEEKTTSSIIYETYYIKKYMDTLNYHRHKGIKINDEKIDSLVFNNKIFNKLNEEIIYSNCNNNSYVMGMVFNRLLNKRHLKRVEELAFKYNNFFALQYLINNYKKIYTKKEYAFFTKQFSKVKFITTNEITNLIHYLEYLLYSENDVYIEIGTKRLQKKEWENHDFGFLIDQIIEDKGIKL